METFKCEHGKETDSNVIKMKCVVCIKYEENIIRVNMF